MSTSRKEKLQGQIPEDVGDEIDTFEAQLEQKKHGQIDDRVFAETRLRRGVYGQRYDNGQRFAGASASHGYASGEEALAAGKTQEVVDAWIRDMDECP